MITKFSQNSKSIPNLTTIHSQMTSLKEYMSRTPNTYSFSSLPSITPTNSKKNFRVKPMDELKQIIS